MRPLVVALLALAARLALAEAPAPTPAEAPVPAADGRLAYAALPPAPAALPPAPAEPAPRPPAPRGGTGHLGLMVEAGVPEGGTLSVTYRPVNAVRLWAGPAWNYVGFGAQGGVMLVPYRSIIAPSLSFEGGHYFDADLRRFVNSSSGAPNEVTPLLRRVQYDYLAAHVGLELGSPRLAFTLRLGLAWIRAAARGTTRTTDASGNTTAQVYLSDPRLTAALPSLKLGLQTTF